MKKEMKKQKETDKINKNIKECWELIKQGYEIKRLERENKKKLKECPCSSMDRT